jgi:exodeoxyribonuclease VII large subunit
VSDTFTVTELARRIANVVDDAFADDIWLVGEITGLTRPRAHVYFDLVEPRDDPGQVPLAVIPVVLFESNKPVVNRALKRFNVGRMDNGVRVRIRGQVLYSARTGRVQFRMTGIDPEYTLGQIALDRDRVLRALRAEGLVERNSKLPFPVVPLRIGLVTAAASAAYHDFVQELTASGYGFHVLHVDTRVQGAGAGAQVAAALRTLARLDVDVIALVRGGGARADLVAFDGEELARTIALLGVPVLTGVGHEVDRSLADDVAHRAYKTPTACAASLVETVRTFHHHTDVLWDEIVHAAGFALDQHAATLDARARASARAARASVRGAAATTDALAVRVTREVTHTLGRAGYRLERTLERTVAAAGATLTRNDTFVERAAGIVRTRAPRELAAAERQLDHTAARLRALDPARLLARGWSITTTADGRLLRSSSTAEPGAVLVTRLADGTVTSTVTTTAPPAGNHHDG